MKLPKLPQKLTFLKSIRFWKLVLVGIIQALVTQGVITQEIALPIEGILLGSITIRTIDKISGK